MKKLYILLLSFSLLFIADQVSAQLYRLQADSLYGLKDTLRYGDSAFIYYRLRNISDSNRAYTGSIFTYLKTDLDTKPIRIDSQFVSILNGSEAIINANFKVITPYFEKDKRSIVVVWPTGTGSVVFRPGFDSIKTTMQVENNVSVAESKNNVNYVRFYPNPTQDILHFGMLKTEMQIHKIIMRDMQGRAIKYFDTDLKSNAIDLSTQKAGIYFMEIIFSDNKTAKYRVIKTE